MDTNDIFNLYDANGDGDLRKKEFNKAWRLVNRLIGGELEGKPW